MLGVLCGDIAGGARRCCLGCCAVLRGVVLGVLCWGVAGGCVPLLLRGVGRMGVCRRGVCRRGVCRRGCAAGVCAAWALC